MNTITISGTMHDVTENYYPTGGTLARTVTLMVPNLRESFPPEYQVSVEIPLAIEPNGPLALRSGDILTVAGTLQGIVAWIDGPQANAGLYVRAIALELQPAAA